MSDIDCLRMATESIDSRSLGGQPMSRRVRGTNRCAATILARLEAVSRGETIDQVGFRLTDEVDPHRRRQSDLTHVELVIRTRHDHEIL